MIASWPMPSGIGAWGLGHDHTHLWVTSIALLGGDDSLTELTEGGTATGVSHALPWSSDPDWYADITYNKNTGRLWAMEVGGNNCIHEFHPSTQLIHQTASFTLSQAGFDGFWSPSLQVRLDGGSGWH